MSAKQLLHDWLFRPYLAADLPELLDLWVTSWSEVYPEINFEQRRGWLIEHIAQWLSDGGLCQVTHDGRNGEITGFILLKPDTGHLDQFCIGASRKGSGCAQALMSEARRLSPLGIHLDVNALNLRAIRFYEREGFVKTGESVNPRSGLPIFFYRWQP